MFLRNVIRAALLVVTALASTALPGRALDLKLGSVVPSEQERADEQSLREGQKLLKEQRPKQAAEEFRKISAAFEEKYGNDKERFFCARTREEEQTYMLMAARAHAGSSRILPMNWAMAYFLEAYSLIEAGKYSEARAPLDRAVSLSPMNAMFLSELGHLQQRDRNWPAALKTFKLAEGGVAFSPPDIRNTHLTRALRGQGSTYIVMGRLDDAEKAYRKCLRIDGSDKVAARQLAFLHGLRGKLRRLH